MVRLTLGSNDSLIQTLCTVSQLIIWSTISDVFLCHILILGAWFYIRCHSLSYFDTWCMILYQMSFFVIFWYLVHDSIPHIVLQLVMERYRMLIIFWLIPDCTGDQTVDPGFSRFNSCIYMKHKLMICMFLCLFKCCDMNEHIDTFLQYVCFTLSKWK
jgi:hypothetical protein